VPSLDNWRSRHLGAEHRGAAA